MSATKSIHPPTNGYLHNSSQSSIESANRSSWASSNSSSAAGSRNGKAMGRFPHIKDLAARAGTEVDKHAPVCPAVTQGSALSQDVRGRADLMSITQDQNPSAQSATSCKAGRD